MNRLCNVVGVLQRLLRRIWHDDEYTDAPLFPWQSPTCSFTIFFFWPHCIVPIMIRLLATENDHSIRMSDNTLRIQMQGHGQGFPTSCYFIFSCLNSSRVYILWFLLKSSLCACACAYLMVLSSGVYNTIPIQWTTSNINMLVTAVSFQYCSLINCPLYVLFFLVTSLLPFLRDLPMISLCDWIGSKLSD